MDIALIEGLLYVLIAAGVGRGLSRKVGQPVILGELLMGMLLGNFVMVSLDKTILDLADMGILFLLFSAGFTINLEEFKRLGKSSVMVSFAGVAITFFAGYLSSIFFGFGQLTSLFVGTALVATSVGIQAAVLREFNLLRTGMGTLTIGAAVADDVMSIIILAILGAMVSFGGSLVNTILMLVLGALVFFSLSLTAGIRFIRVLSRRFVVRKENLMLLALIIILVFGLIAEEIGLEMIIGAFIAGLLLGQSYFARDILEQISIFGEAFFIPIFFVTTGMAFDLNSMASVGVFAIAIILIAVLSKIIGCGLGASLSGFNPRKSLAIGVAMVPRGEMALIVSGIGLRYGRGIMGQEIVSAILLMTIVTTVITPPLLKSSLRRVKPN